MIQVAVSPYLDTAQEPASEVRMVKPKPIRQLRYCNAPIVETILMNVTIRYGVTPTQIRSKDRHKSIARARHVAAWLMWRADMSYPEIGLALNRDRTSMMYAVKNVEAWLAKEPNQRAALEAMTIPSDPPEVRMVPGVGMVLDDWSAEGLARAIGIKSGPMSSSEGST